MIKREDLALPDRKVKGYAQGAERVDSKGGEIGRRSGKTFATQSSRGSEYVGIEW